MRKNALDHYMEEQCQSWAQALKSKDLEIESLKMEYPYSKKQMEWIKLQTLEEYTLANAMKWKLLDQDLEKYKSRCLELSIQNNRLTSELSRQEKNQLELASELKQHHEDETSLLQTKIATLLAEREATSDMEKVRNLSREKSELEVSRTCLLNENQELRAHIDDVKKSLEQQSRVHKKQVLEYSTTVKTLQSEIDGYKIRITGLVDELYDLKREQDANAAKMQTLQKEVDTLTNRNESRCHEFNLEVNQFKIENLKAQDKYESDIKILQGKLKELELSLQMANDAKQKAHEEVFHQEKEYVKKIQWTREQEWEKLAQLETEKSDIENQLHHHQKENSGLTAKLESMEKEMSMELSRMKETINHLTHDKENLLANNSKLNSERERHLNKATEFSIRLEELKTRLDKANQEIERLGSESQHLKHENHRLTNLNDQLTKETRELSIQMEKEIVAQEHNLERIKSQWMNERVQFQQELQSCKKEYTELSETCKAWESASKKQQTLYLTKANHLKIQLKEMTAQLQCKEVENIKTKEHLEELKNKQANFLQFLQSEVS